MKKKYDNLPYCSNNQWVYNRNSYQNIHNSPKFPSLHENRSNDDPFGTDDSSKNDNTLRNYNDNVIVFEKRMMHPNIFHLIELSRFLTHNLPPMKILVFLVLFFDLHFDLWFVIDLMMLMNVLCCFDHYVRVWSLWRLLEVDDESEE